MGDSPESLPFQLTLVDLDRTSYLIGDSLTFEVLVKHVGQKPFSLPWGREKSAFSSAKGPGQRAAFLLTFTDSQLGRQYIGHENSTYGFQSVPGSFLVVRPGDTVRVRAKGRWYLMAGFPKPPPDGWSKDISVRAELQLHGLSGVLPLVDSTNTLEIRLQER
jgi:hypothetical protein